MTTNFAKVSLTQLETLLSNPPRGKALGLQVVDRFDPHAGLQYASQEYTFDNPLEPTDSEIELDWVERTLITFVRGEFGTAVRQYRPPPPEPRFAESRPVDPSVVLYRYLESCEHELVFSGFANAVARQTRGDTVERLYALLTHPLLGNVANLKNVSLEDFRAKVGRRIDEGQRLIFTFPAFPFKDQNPFRTMCTPSHPDLGEVALLIRLHTLSVAIYQSYHIGAEWLILTDGTAYSDALRVPVEEALQYQDALRGFRNQLDLGRAIHIGNLLDVCAAFDTPEGEWNGVINVIEESLRSARLGSDARRALAFLTYGMKRNVNLNDLRGDTSWGEWWDILTAEYSQVRPEGREQWDAVQSVAETSAIKYAAFNLAIRWFGLERTLLPPTIRATIHPKSGQIAVPSLGREFPWNGTAYITEDKVNVHTVSTAALRDLCERGEPIVRYIDGTGMPFLCLVNGA